MLEKVLSIIRKSYKLSLKFKCKKFIDIINNIY